MEQQRRQRMDQIMDAQRDFFRMIQIATTSHWMQLDLTMTQFRALIALCEDEPVTIGYLGQRLGIGLPAASQIVERLVRLGLADRCEDPSDRRRTYVRLTNESDALLARLRQGGRELMTEWLGQLSDAELEALTTGLSALVAAGRGALALSEPTDIPPSTRSALVKGGARGADRREN